MELARKGAVQPPDSNPNLDTPDDDGQQWPVYLGKVAYDATATDPSKVFTVTLDGRIYAGAVASTIRHPREAVRVTLGGDKEVFTVDAANDDPRLEIRADQTNILRGDTTVEGTLRLNGGAIQFPTAATGDLSPTVPSIYRASPGATDELRIDLGELSQGDRCFVIGHTKNGTFVPAITLTFQQIQGQVAGTPEIVPQVTIHGDLHMEGLIDAPDTKFRTLSAEVLAALQAMFQSGLAAGGGP
jgi:hypothetical protein